MITLGMALVTYGPRVLPVVILNKINLHPLLLKWLRLIPAAVLGALTAQSIFMRQAAVTFSWRNIYFLAAIPCFVIAFKTKSLLWTVAGGLLSMILLNHLKPFLF